MNDILKTIEGNLGAYLHNLNINIYITRQKSQN